MSDSIQEEKQNLKETMRNLWRIGTGLPRGTTELVEKTMNKTFDIAGETINATGDIAGETINATGDIAGQTIKTTGLLTKSAVGATGSVAKAGIESSSKVSVRAVEAVGDGLTGIGKGANRIGNITGNSAKASLERFRVRNEGNNLRNDKLTQYRENEKTEDLYSDLNALSKSGKKTRIYREEIIGKCINDIGNKIPPPKDYPLNKRGDHCKRMVNCKVYGKQENKKKISTKCF